MERKIADLSAHSKEAAEEKPLRHTASGAPPSTQKRFDPALLIIPAVALTGLIAFGAIPRYMQQNALVSEKREQLKEAPSVSFTIAQLGPEHRSFVLPGSTQAIQDAPIYARVNGYLAKRYVDIGDRVKNGELLADIETPDIDQQVAAAENQVAQATANFESSQETLAKAEADLHTAQANVKKSRTDLQFDVVEFKRYRDLATQGAVSLEDRDSKLQTYNAGVAGLEAMNSAERSAAAQVRTAKAAVRASESALRVAKSNLEQTRATQSFKHVRASFDGVVTQRNVDAGALITSGSSSNNTVLFEVTKNDLLRVNVYVPEQYVPDVHVGEQATLKFQEYPGQKFVGVVSNIAGGLDAGSRTLQVEIKIANKDGKLLPNMYAQVEFETPAGVRLPRVPAATVETRSDGQFIYTVDAQNRIHKNRIKIDRDLGGSVEINSGISAGDRAVVNPTDWLTEGLVVSPVEAPAEQTAK